MSEIKKKHDNDPAFLNEKGEFDYAKLLEANPNLLASFIHKKEDEQGSEGDSEFGQATMAFAIGDAARRFALGLSESYAPIESAEQIQAMAMSAQAHLGLEAGQGLSMEMGGGGTFNAAYRSEDSPESQQEKSRKSQSQEDK